ncbi:SRPBCC family protein [Cohnella ginsengisoli]|uniref:SRPBCC family protein n=1 Tax=Cohnella ginsengisoli TaxID=425004 RepID=A0A9X4KSM0_9BACL|nr:SRPBCC family protein [Cohnella ginsengisoli]MDG0794850.1 SRPBCC family protein [Cohnella ginsengisoli]
MEQRSAHHATFTVERTYPATPERVYKAWSDAEAKARWFTPAETFDFRVGGREYSRGGPPDGPVFTFDACYQDIVPNARIVYSYVLDMDDKRISASVTTVELHQAEGGTRLVFTEQGVFLDGLDTPEQREHGTNVLLNMLGDALRSESEAS